MFIVVDSCLMLIWMFTWFVGWHLFVDVGLGDDLFNLLILLLLLEW